VAGRDEIGRSVVSKKINVTVRLDRETVDRIDAYLEQFYPLVETRVAMTRLLLKTVIAAIDARAIPFSPEKLRRFMDDLPKR
jgi:hypothetical protein